MKRHLLRYLIFLLPAFFLTQLARVAAPTGMMIAARWFGVFFMLFGYGLCTAVFAYRMPKPALSFILYYTGANLLIITAFYATPYGTPLYGFFRHYAGALSYVPLEILVDALLDFNIKHEVFVTLLLAGCCMAGYLSGLLRRRSTPDPYSPTIG